MGLKQKYRIELQEELRMLARQESELRRSVRGADAASKAEVHAKLRAFSRKRGELRLELQLMRQEGNRPLNELRRSLARTWALLTSRANKFAHRSR